MDWFLYDNGLGHERVNNAKELTVLIKLHIHKQGNTFARISFVIEILYCEFYRIFQKKILNEDIKDIKK